MGQIIKQPNGKFCIFSTVVDNVTICQCTEQDIIDNLVEEAKVEIERKVKGVVEKLNNGEQPYHQFTISYTEMIKTIRDIHGKGEANKIKTIIES